MIEIFEGAPGGGKSYMAVLRLLAHWSRGGTAYSNLPIVWEECKAYVKRTRGLELKDSQWVQLSDKRPVLDTQGNQVYDLNGDAKIVNEVANFQNFSAAGTRALPTLAIFDEAHLYWNARAWKETQDKSKQMLDFLTQSRHGHTDIIFITQHHRNLDSQMARLIQFRWTFRDLARAKIAGIGWPWQTTLAVQWDLDGKTMVSRRFQRRKAEIFKLYDSHAWHTEIARAGQVDAVDVGQREGGKLSRVPWKLVMVGVVFLSCILGAWWVLRDPTSSFAGKGKGSGDPGAAPVSADSPAVPVSSSQSLGVFSEGVSEVQPTPENAGVGVRILCIDALTQKDGGVALVVETEHYGRMRVGAGDILPPYEIVCITDGNRKLPDVLALNLEENKMYILKPFMRGENRKEKENEFRDFLAGHFNGVGSGTKPLGASNVLGADPGPEPRRLDLGKDLLPPIGQ